MSSTLSDVAYCLLGSLIIMIRKYVRKSAKQLHRTNLKAAFKHRVATTCSIKAAAEECGVKKTTLVVSLKIHSFHLGYIKGLAFTSSVCVYRLV